jgi:ABC-type Fe3+-siderophore transport system permease subunit
MFACSGPNAMAKIARNTEIGHQHAAIVGGLVVASVVVYLFARRRWGVPVTVLALFALHPSWTVGTLSGDCGYFVRDASPILTWVAGLIVAVQAAYTGWVLVRGAGSEARGDYDETPGGAKIDGRISDRYD